MSENQLPDISSAKASCMQIYTQAPSEDQMLEARKLADTLDTDRSDSVLRFGAAIQANMPRISDRLIEISQRDDTAEAALFINKITASIDSFCHIAKPGLFGTTPEKAQKIFDAYRALKIDILRSTASLETSRRSLTRTIILLEQLHVQNLDLYNQLTVAVAAGELKLDDMRVATDACSVPENIDRFEKKLHDLRLSKTVCMQTAVQIFFLKSSCDSLMDRIQSIITTIVPLWETQVSLALGISNMSSQIAGLSGASAAFVSMSKKSSQQIKAATADLKSKLGSVIASFDQDKAHRRAI